MKRHLTMSQFLTKDDLAEAKRQQDARDDVEVDDVIAWAEGITGALGSEIADRVTDKEAAIADAIIRALTETADSIPSRFPMGNRT